MQLLNNLNQTKDGEVLSLGFTAEGNVAEARFLPGDAVVRTVQENVETIHTAKTYEGDDPRIQRFFNTKPGDWNYGVWTEPADELKHKFVAMLLRTCRARMEPFLGKRVAFNGESLETIIDLFILGVGTTHLTSFIKNASIELDQDRGELPPKGSLTDEEKFPIILELLTQERIDSIVDFIIRKDEAISIGEGYDPLMVNVRVRTGRDTLNLDNRSVSYDRIASFSQGIWSYTGLVPPEVQMVNFGDGTLIPGNTLQLFDMDCNIDIKVPETANKIIKVSFNTTSNKLVENLGYLTFREVNLIVGE